MITLQFTTPSQSDPATPDTGRRRVIPLFIVPVVKESHTSMFEMFQTVTFPEHYKYNFSPDLSALNKMLGLSTHSATYPCYGCTFNQYSPDAQTKPRTIKSIHDNFKMYSNAGENAQHKDYFSCVAEPIPAFTSMFPPETPTTSFVVPPALHILLGILNWLFHHIVGVTEMAREWPKRLHLKPSGYHGGKDYNGNACRTLLRRIDILEDILSKLRVGKTKKILLSLYVKALKNFDSVVHSCFGKTLESNWKVHVCEFKTSIHDILKFTKQNRVYLKNITPRPPHKETSKLHILFSKVIPWCEKTERGLGCHSEQSFETAHHDFYSLWGSYKVSDIENPNYGKRLLRCVLHFVSSHVPSNELINFTL